MRSEEKKEKEILRGMERERKSEREREKGREDEREGGKEVAAQEMLLLIRQIYT